MSELLDVPLRDKRPTETLIFKRLVELKIPSEYAVIFPINLGGKSPQLRALEGMSTVSSYGEVKLQDDFLDWLSLLTLIEGSVFSYL